MTTDLDAQEQEFFRRLTLGLGAASSQVVLIGGWAHRLFPLHPLLAHEVEKKPALTTVDADIGLPQHLSTTTNLHQQMLDAGFRADLLGSTTPALTKYRLGPEAGNFYVEFLAPLYGSDTNRQGQPRGVSEIAGVTVQHLRGLDLLLVDPWSFDLPIVDGLDLHLQVAHPVAYITQKLLHLEHRQLANDRAKDLLYVHDTLALFWLHLEQLHPWWVNYMHPVLTPSQLKKLAQARMSVCTELSSIAVGASQYARAMGRNLPVAELQARCDLGLHRLLDQAA